MGKYLLDMKGTSLEDFLKKEATAISFGDSKKFRWTPKIWLVAHYTDSDHAAVCFHERELHYIQQNTHEGRGIQCYLISPAKIEGKY
jgi:hypothetical protein